MHMNRESSSLSLSLSLFNYNNSQRTDPSLPFIFFPWIFTIHKSDRADVKWPVDGLDVVHHLTFPSLTPMHYDRIKDPRGEMAFLINAETTSVLSYQRIIELYRIPDYVCPNVGGWRGVKWWITSILQQFSFCHFSMHILCFFLFFFGDYTNTSAIDHVRNWYNSK